MIKRKQTKKWNIPKLKKEYERKGRKMMKEK